jgi:hypothetical protein
MVFKARVRTKSLSAQRPTRHADTPIASAPAISFRVPNEPTRPSLLAYDLQSGLSEQLQGARLDPSLQPALSRLARI